MNRLNSNIVVGFTMCLSLLAPFKLVSQNPIGELEIKRSNKYFWGQGYNADTSQARLDARDELMLMISNQISNSGPLNAKSDLMVICIRYIYKPVEELTKVIAYVTKEDVTNIIENKLPLVVKEIKYSEAKMESENKNIKETQVQPLDNKSVDQKKELLSEKSIRTVSTPPGEMIIDRLIACNTSDELHMFLKNEENRNTLIFSWNSKVYRNAESSENFYIAIIDPKDSRIVALLDKGKVERKDLKNEHRIINIKSEYPNMIQVWIQLL